MKKNEQIQLTISLNKKQHQKLQAIAAIEETSIEAIIKRFIDKGTKEDRKGCPYNHTPNQKTIQALKEVEQGKNLVKAKNVQDLFKKLGI